MIPKYRAWDKETKTMNGMAEIYRNRNQEIELRPRDRNIVLMQSTGLVDKNGKEIFEGDIVTDGEFARIVQYHQTLGFYMFDEEDNERFFSDSANLEDFEEDAKIVSEILEIIGNVYENPELLEVTE